MPQDTESGQRANQWGIQTARQIAQEIGATMPRKSSNVVRHRGKDIAIKCARFTNTTIEVSYQMLTKIDFVYGAFYPDGQTRNMWRLPVKTYKELSRRRRKNRPCIPKEGRAQVGKRAFIQHGTLI